MCLLEVRGEVHLHSPPDAARKHQRRHGTTGRSMRTQRAFVVGLAAASESRELSLQVGGGLGRQHADVQ